MTALSTGWIFSASTAAWAKNGRKVSLTPSRAWKAALARSRSRAMLVTSASTTVVSWAAVCSDSTIRLAMTWRGRGIRWGVPRSACRLEHVLLPDPAADPGAGDGLERHRVLHGQLAHQRRHVGRLARRQR